MNDETKLPKWAQWELASLRQDVQRLENENKVLRSQWPKSNTALLSLGKKGYEDIWLPESAQVRFYIEGSVDYPDSFYVDARVDRENGSLLTLMGYTSIRVVPQVSNVVHIEAAR